MNILEDDLIAWALDRRQKRVERILNEVENAYKQERNIVLTDIEKIELVRILQSTLCDIENRRKG